MKFKNELILLAIILIWGNGMIAAKFMLTGFDTVPGLAVRYLSAFPVMLGYAVYVLKRDPARRKGFITATTVKMAALAGSFGVASLILQTTALRYTTASNASFIMCTYTVIMPIMAAMFFKDKIHTAQIWGLFSCFIGTALISRIISFEGGLHLSLEGLGFGDALMLICALTAASQTLVVGRLLRVKVDSLGFAICQITYSLTVFSLAWLILFPDGRAQFTNLPALLGILYNGAFGSGAVYVVYCAVMPRLSPAAAGLILAFEPVVTTLAAAIIPIQGKTEPVGLVQIIGGALILGTIIAVQCSQTRGATAAPTGVDGRQEGEATGEI